MLFTFKLSEAEANTILAALVQQPYGQVVEIIKKLHEQANEQIKPAEPTTGYVREA